MAICRTELFLMLRSCTVQIDVGLMVDAICAHH
jgi:hypothetical protein